MARSRRVVAETLPNGVFDVRFEEHEYDPEADRQAAIDKVAKQTIEQLGVDADSAYVTHHDVLRAAKLSAQLALQGVDIEHIWQLLRDKPSEQQQPELDNAQGEQ